jgi:apolipoprotein D and lipocalin family protein
MLLAACTGVPDGVEPVENFDLDRYLGSWYEIARLDHRFERGLTDVTATYSVHEDGGVRVVNRGFNGTEWKEAVGKAYLTDAADVGRLKVSFFGPFYGGYNVILLDPGYKYAMVAGPDRSYLWILARSPEISTEKLQNIVDHARELQFPVDDLIYVSHQAIQR